MENRDGIAGAIAFAMQCRNQYRKAVSASRKRGFIESYLAFKRYIETPRESLIK